ncbi:unnamed protein product [Calypogeia fissa]
MAFIDSPRREPVPQFGAWRLEDPGSPVVDYTEMFSRARASRLGSMPQDDYDEDDYYSRPGEASRRYSSDSRTMARHSSRKNFLHFFVCGARTQAVA